MSVGKEISAQEAADILLRLVSDRSIVQALFTSSGCSYAALIGVLYPSDGGTAVVKVKRSSEQPVLRFYPSAASAFRLGDEHLYEKTIFKQHRAVSALSFHYPDKTVITLIELMEEPIPNLSNVRAAGV